MRMDPDLGELKIGLGLGGGVERALGGGDAKGVEGEMDGGFQLVEAGDGLTRPLGDFIEAGCSGAAVPASASGLFEALVQEIFLCDERIAASFHGGELVTQEHDGVEDVALDVVDALPGNGPSDGLPPVTGRTPDLGQVVKEGAPRGEGSFFLHGGFQDGQPAGLRGDQQRKVLDKDFIQIDVLCRRPEAILHDLCRAASVVLGEV